MMGDLISREALLVALDYGRTHNVGVRQIVSEAPTIDAVPVVRCKDCRNSLPITGAAHTLFCTPDLKPVESDDFCSAGKRVDSARMDADAPERAEGGGV